MWTTSLMMPDVVCGRGLSPNHPDHVTDVACGGRSLLGDRTTHPAPIHIGQKMMQRLPTDDVAIGTGHTRACSIAASAIVCDPSGNSVSGNDRARPVKVDLEFGGRI